MTVVVTLVGTSARVEFDRRGAEQLMSSRTQMSGTTVRVVRRHLLPVPPTPS
jgi:hypothetical protein